MLVDQMTLLLALGTLNLLALGALALWIRSELENAVEELDSIEATVIPRNIDGTFQKSIDDFE
jgi:hypothetical protein